MANQFKTNQQRLAYFGPAWILRSPSARYVSLIPGHLEQKCAVAGLIVNTLWMTESKLTMFGAHCESRPHPGTTGETTPLSGCQVPYPAIPGAVWNRWCRGQTKATRANLTKVKQLRVQKRRIVPEYDLRCAGLLIHHTDGSIETLGCYDASLTAPSQLIYDCETDGELHGLVFHLRARPHLFNGNIRVSYYVSKIVARAKRPREQQAAKMSDYIVDDEDLEPEEAENEEDSEVDDEDPEDENLEDFPAAKTLHWSTDSPQPVSNSVCRKKKEKEKRLL